MTSRKSIENAAVVVSVLVCALGAVRIAARGARMQPQARSTIAFVSTRHDPAADPAVDPRRALNAGEIYLMDGDARNTRRLTENTSFDGFPELSPDGTRIVFDSNRRRTAAEPVNGSDLFVMNTDGTGQILLTRGSSATWSPDGKSIAFHASASGTGLPIKPDPGAATSDSDIFVVNVADVLKNQGQSVNITNNPAMIDDDPDWAPAGRKIVFTSHLVTDDAINSSTAELYVIDLEGTGKPVRLTNNSEEERAPSWFPDGRRILFSCKRGGAVFELCTMNPDGRDVVQLTHTGTGHLTASWSPDGKTIIFHRRVGERAQFQLFSINADGSGEKQLTFPPGFNGFPNWGKVPGDIR